MRAVAEVVVVLAVWAFAVAAIAIMKKFDPENMVYPIWTILVCILLTLFVGWYESWWIIFR